MGAEKRLPHVEASESEQHIPMLARTPYRVGILAVGGVSLILTWITLSAGFFGEQSVTGWETDIGKIYFLILFTILLVELTGNLDYVRKAWLVGGVLLALAVIGQIFHAQSVMSDVRAEAASEGFGGMIGLSFGIGLYLALAVGIVASYIGYQITSDASRPVFEDALAPLREELGSSLRKVFSHPVLQPKYGSWPDTRTSTGDKEGSLHPVEFDPTSAINTENDLEQDSEQHSPSGKTNSDRHP